MALSDFLEQTATITTEPRNRDTLGGADRTATWPTVASDVPCLVRPLSASIQVRDDARRNITIYRIYFEDDPVETGIGTRHRVTVDGVTYQVTGVVNANSLSRIFHVDAEAIKNTS